MGKVEVLEWNEDDPRSNFWNVGPSVPYYMLAPTMLNTVKGLMLIGKQKGHKLIICNQEIRKTRLQMQAIIPARLANRGPYSQRTTTTKSLVDSAAPRAL